MAYNETEGRAEYTASAGQTLFPFGFKIFFDSDIKVYLTPVGQPPSDLDDLLILATDYTASINGDLGGVLTLANPSSANDSITIVRDLPVTRPIEYQTNGDLLADTLNTDQDYQTYLIADRDANGNRYLSIPDSAQNVSTELPSPEALRVLRWNDDESALENAVVGSNDIFINILNVDKISDLASVNKTLYSTVNVRGYYVPNDGGGGIFNYDATQTGINDGGIIINGWVRQYSGMINIKWFGAKGDGVNDNTSIILDIEASLYNDFYIPAGEFLIESSLIDLTKRYSGEGRIVTTESSVKHRRARTITHALEAPVIQNGSSIINGFDGEFITDDVKEVYVAGATTVGNPINGDGYIIQDQTAGNFGFYLFTSGKNANPYNNADRTGWFQDRRRLTHLGKADAWHASWNVTVGAKDPLIIGIQGVPAGGQLAGDTFAAVDDVILQNMEFNINDNGYDVVGKGLVLNLHRDNDTASKDQHWMGVRVQSVGTKLPDSAFQAVGSFSNGIDFAQADTINRAVSLKKGQKIEFDCPKNFIKTSPLWITSEIIEIGTYRYYDGNTYLSATAGTTGTIPPTHTSGTVSDGGVDWQWIVASSFAGATKESGSTFIRVDEASGFFQLKAGFATIFNAAATFLNTKVDLLTSNIIPEVTDTSNCGTESKRWVGINSAQYNTGAEIGKSGTFTTNDGKTITVTVGIITGIV